MVKKEELLTTAQMLLGEEVCEGIQQWYNDTLIEDARYVVYVVRRCYMLALIMECITGEKMKDNEEKEFLTDASFFLRCEEMADYYRQSRKFPKIMLCDDILIHGRNLNHLLESIEEKLCEILDEYDREEIVSALVTAIQIKVYVCASAPLLLLGRYELNLNYKCKENPIFWRKVSSNISTLILRADVANACYVYSEPVTKTVYKKIKSAENWTKTVFQNTIERTWIQYNKNENTIKAIYTVRVIQNQMEDKYRVVPFVFLPNLNEVETEDIKRAIFTSLGRDESWLEIQEYIEKLSQISGKRVFNEWLTLLISQTILREFHNRFSINLNSNGRSYQEERNKLKRNYNCFGEKITFKILDFTINQKVLGLKEIDDILSANISEHFILEVDSINHSLDLNQKQIQQTLENYFYKNGVIEERSAYELSQIAYVPSQRRSMRKVRGCCFTLAELNEGYNQKEIDYCLAYFLQMMDAGVLAISSYASKNTKVVGFAQFAKAGEQSLQIYPLRMYEYIPLLNQIEKRCELNILDFNEELEKFFESVQCNFTEKEKDRIRNFLDVIKGIGQKPSDWNANYLMKMDFDYKEGENKNRVHYLIRYLKRQMDYVEKYKAYINEEVY